MIWTSETINKLRELWPTKASTAAIGRELGGTKNAIVGKAHRLDLPARPSPIHRSATPKTLHPPSPRPLPPLASLRDPPPPPPRAVVVTIARPAVATPPPAAPPGPLAPVVFISPPPRPTPPPQPRRRAECLWPIGEPGRPGFRYCGDHDVAPGKPYCTEHAKLAYVKIRDRREDADDGRFIMARYR